MQIKLYRWAVYLSADAPPVYHCYAENEEMAKADFVSWWNNRNGTESAHLDLTGLFAKRTA